MEDPLLERVEAWCRAEGVQAVRFEDPALLWGLHLLYPKANPKRIDVLRQRDREGALVFLTGLKLAPGQVEVLKGMGARERTELVWELYMHIVEHGALASFHRADGVLARLQLQKELFFGELDRPAFLEGLRDAHSLLVWLISAVQRTCGRERAARQGRGRAVRPAAPSGTDEELPMFR